MPADVRQADLKHSNLGSLKRLHGENDDVDEEEDDDIDLVVAQRPG